jgi:hypothetical protein
MHLCACLLALEHPGELGVARSVAVAATVAAVAAAVSPRGEPENVRRADEVDEM